MEIKVKYKGGSSFVNLAPQFTEDSQTLILASKNYLVSYNVKTGKRLKTYHGISNKIIAFQLHHINGNEHVTACSKTGEIVSWGVQLGYKVLRLNASDDLKRISGNNLGAEEYKSFNLYCDGKESKHKILFLVSYVTTLKGEKYEQFGIIDIIKGRWRSLCSLNLKVNAGNSYVAVSSGEEMFFAVAQNTSLFYSAVNGDHQKHLIAKSKHFTSIACHPTEASVITGDSLGRVLLWHNLRAKATYAVFHWHTLPVRCLAFSKLGTHFYSGGGECVLVKWDPSNVHYQNFLPRLSSTIEQMAVSNANEFVAVSTGDNAIKVLDSRLETVSIIQHLVLASDFPAGVIYDNRTKSLIMNGIIGHLQFFSPEDRSLLYNLDIVGQNKMTENRYRHLENTNVTRVAVHGSGLWLATVEARYDVSYSGELRLKFWAYNTVKQLFELNTCIELPHEKSVNEILFQPNYDNDIRCVTVGNDKKFKVWELSKVDTLYRKSNMWHSTKVGFYRGLMCQALAFSTDGSLLAVGFGPIVTAWTPDTCEVKCSLVHPSGRERINTIHFGITNQCHLLVAASSDYLSVWNVLSLHMVWTVPLGVNLLIANPQIPCMAVFTIDQKLFIFSPDKSEPLFSTDLEEDAIAATFAPRRLSSDNNSEWYRGTYLYFIDSNRELFSVDADEDSSETANIFETEITNSLFASMLPDSKSGNLNDVQSVRHVDNIAFRNTQFKELLNAPVHTMIPMKIMCASLLRSVIKELR